MEKLIKAKEQIEEGPLKKVNLFLLIFLSIITLGAYIGVWFLRQREEINQLSRKNGIHFGLWRWFVAISFTFLFIRFFGATILSDYGMAYMLSFDTIFSYLFIGLLYYSIFRLKDLLEFEDGLELNNYLLFFLHIFYIQFKINTEKSKSVGLVRG